MIRVKIDKLNEIHVGTLLFASDDDFVQLWPIFAGDKESFFLGVVGDSVQDIFGGIAFVSWIEAGKIDPTEDLAVLG